MTDDIVGVPYIHYCVGYCGQDRSAPPSVNQGDWLKLRSDYAG